VLKSLTIKSSAIKKQKAYRRNYTAECVIMTAPPYVFLLLSAENSVFCLQ